MVSESQKREDRSNSVHLFLIWPIWKDKVLSALKPTPITEFISGLMVLDFMLREQEMPERKSITIFRVPKKTAPLRKFQKRSTAYNKGLPGACGHAFALQARKWFGKGAR
jgi:hypothetical protein